MDGLFKAIYAIKTPVLTSFIKTLLGNPILAINMVQSPAEDTSNYAYKGGLVEHSLDVARTMCLSSGEQEMKDLGIVAALIHDLDKVEKPVQVEEEYVENRETKPNPIIRLCERALAQLAKENQYLAMQLRHFLNSLVSVDKSDFACNSELSRMFQLTHEFCIRKAAIKQKISKL